MRGELHVLDIYIPIDESEYERLYRTYKVWFRIRNNTYTKDRSLTVPDARTGDINGPTAADTYALLMLMKRCGYTPPPVTTYHLKQP